MGGTPVSLSHLRLNGKVGNHFKTIYSLDFVLTIFFHQLGPQLKPMVNNNKNGDPRKLDTFRCSGATIMYTLNGTNHVWHIYV